MKIFASFLPSTKAQKFVCASVIRLSCESSYHSQYWKCKFKQSMTIYLTLFTHQPSG